MGVIIQVSKLLTSEPKSLPSQVTSLIARQPQPSSTTSPPLSISNRTNTTPMPPFRPLSRLSAFQQTSCKPFRSSKSPLIHPTRTLASTHPPEVSEHPSPDTASHESHYDPPSGWLFGVPPGQKYEKEGWETTWVYGFWGSLLFGVVAYAYKPDTSIQTWALEEARRRLEAEGVLPDPDDEKK
ncbi:hypothetical protein MMC21_001377 [Puttea exsequens]|nr:hypothetical protein [Puttea exsequens]